MKKGLALILAALTVTCGVSSPALADGNTTTFYVATDGSDDAAGTAKAPFATVQKALEATRAVEGPTVIIFRAGTYKMTETIELTEADSDTVFVADGEVTFKGGKDIPFEAFTKVTDQAILSRLAEEGAREKLMVADLAALGTTDLGQIKPQGFLGVPDDSGYNPKNTNVPGTDRGFAPTLTYNDRYLTMAEYPNNGQFCRISSVVSKKDEQGRIRYTVDDDRWQNWQNATDIWASGYYENDWADDTTPAEVSADGIITAYTYHNVAENYRARFFNLLEEIDLPGEYYIDREAGKLYMILPEGFVAGQHLTFSSFDEKIFSLKSAKDVSFYGIRFEGTCDQAIYADATDGLYINDCEFTAIGDTAIYLNRCYNTTIENSYLHDLGAGGVYLNYCGDRENLIPGNNRIVNCHIERFSQYRRTYTPGIHMYRDMGNVVSHCEINDAPHFAIRYDSNDNIIEYCEFYRLCTETADSGAVYSGRYYNTWGNVIRYNYFHDLSLIDTDSGMQMQAIYLDDCSSQTNIYGNFFYHCDTIALFGGGRNIVFENNLMVENNKSVVFDNRGISWGDRAVNAALANSDTIQWETEIWAERYPQLMTLRNDETGIPKYNVIRNNILFSTPLMNLHEMVVEYGTVENNWVTADYTIFNDYLSNDFSLWEGSSLVNPAFQRVPEFQNLPFDQMGRYEYTVDLSGFIPAEQGNETSVTIEPETDDTDMQPQKSGLLLPWIIGGAMALAAVMAVISAVIGKKK